LRQRCGAVGFARSQPPTSRSRCRSERRAFGGN
jgi:hypothetical protein